ncbi:hypothetical protein VTK73DRAFT_730 [Phialemonium thermophilum]|uniref:beta-glucosidase n=1 Tax=Phialemonium thermophilum TaxID=223376 RepID=A0ABR3XDF5_9PEZI
MLLVIIGGGLAGLAALPHGKAHEEVCQSSPGPCSSQDITSDTYFYGQSPPVYPSPNITGSGSWSEAFSKAQALVERMTLEEKLSLTAGITVTSENACSGYIPPITRLKFPGLCLSDAGNGLRSTDFVTSWPSGLHVGASWNKQLTANRGTGMGLEFRRKGVNVLLGPVVGPAGRVLLSGRNWEGFSSDPYLSGALARETVSAVQQVGVITSTKHYIANEQESFRNPANGIEAVSSNLDDKTLHELYLWPFQDAVHAGSGNIMCSYNRVNNSYGCANSKTLNGILKTELGFQGFVVSDWGAQHAGVATALAGLDMAMPTGTGLWGANLSQAVANGSVPESRVTDMATRIIASWYQMGQDKGFPKPGVGMAPDLTKPHHVVDARNSSFRAVVLDGAIEGQVLLKNERKALPLRKPKLLSIFGFSAKAPDQNNVSPGFFSAWTQGDESADFDALIPLLAPGSSGNFPAIAPNGTIVSGGGSGATSQSRIVSPFDALTQQAYDDDTALFWDLASGDPSVHPASDACLVVVNAFATEGFDRPNLHDDYTDGLIKNVADKCNNTIVIFHNAGVRLVDQWIDHANVTALLFAHLPGQDSGKALVSVLYGESSPSGKLPYTVAHNESDYRHFLGPDEPEGIFAMFPQSNFSEGVLTDYRHFDARNITPRFEFGFGLSYTTFAYANLSVAKTELASNTTPATFPTGPTEPGGPADLWDVLVRVRADVRNTGAVAAAEVAQLYVGIPGAAAPRQLRGFEKPFLNASEAATVEFNLTRRDLSVWDVAAQKWRLQNGKYDVWVGGSSRDLPLHGNMTL